VRSKEKDLVKTIFVSFQVPIHIVEEMNASIGFNQENQNFTYDTDPLALLQYQIINS